MPNRRKVEQVAVIAYLPGKKPQKIVLATSLGRKRWVLPKGHIDDGNTPQDAALIEAFEEAGVKGRIQSKSALGTHDYVKPDDTEKNRYFTDVYLMAVDKELDDWPERKERNRTWMTFAEAIDALEEPDLKKIVKKAAKLIDE